MAPSLWEAEPQTPVEVQGNVDATGQGLICVLSSDTSREVVVGLRRFYFESIITTATKHINVS